MLSAQLALALQPFIEESQLSLYYLQMLEGNIVEALCLVIAVDLLQLGIEQASKLIQVLWFLRELDEPLVAALGIAVHIDRSSGIFRNLRTRLLAGIGKSLLGIVHNQLLTKGIDKVLGTAGDDKLVWIGAGKLYGIANHIAPQTAGGGNHHRIVLAYFHAPERHHGRMIASKLIHRDEFVEHIVIYHQRHGWI